MYQDYDHAVGEVTKYFTQNHFSSSVVYSHLNCYRSFKQYLEKNQLPYSHEIAMEWLNSNRPKWKHPRFKASRIALFRINDVLQNGYITGKRYAYENSCNYDKLPDWCRLLLDGYLKDTAHSFCDNYARQHRMACSEFLIYICGVGGTKPEEITHKNVIGYYNEYKHRALKTKNLYNRIIRRFLKHLADKDFIPGSLAFTLDRFSIPRIILLDERPDEKKCVDLFQQDQMSVKILPAEYYSMAKGLGDVFLERHHYSKTMKKTFRKAWRELYVFLEANGLDYSYKVAEHWCNCLENDTVEWKTYRRAMKLFEQYRESGDINPSIVYTYKEDSINTLPDWSRQLLLDFLSKKRESENSVSTVSMYRSSCLRFLKYLEQKKISCCARISPEIIKEFHISDLHSTAEARNGYSTRIRGFLDYLSVLGYVPETLPLALSTECAVKTEIVETLMDEEVAAVYHYRTIAEKPMALRNAAMVLIGLRMGLRASDITGLKLTDVSWDERTISIHQQKSGRFLKLPMPVDVGNSLYQYIMNGRPQMVSEYVFISHRVPYSRLGTGSCCSALNKILDKQKHGFHLTRKTFATRLLISKTNTDTIADSLGHKDNSTVMKYLATDGNTMRQCSLLLKGIEVKGGMLS